MNRLSSPYNKFSEPVNNNQGMIEIPNSHTMSSDATILSLLSGFFSKFFNHDAEQTDRPGFICEEDVEYIQSCSKITEFVHDNDIPSIILLDRSARPAYIGIKEAWRRKYPDSKQPSIYFINPTGFNDADTLLQPQRTYYGNELSLAGLLIEQDGRGKGNDTGTFLNGLRSREAIGVELGEKYSKLAKNKNQPLLIMDTCVHSGKTLAGVMDTLRNVGFTDIRIGVVTDDLNSSGITPDLVCLEGNTGCYTFGQDNLTQRRFGTVVPQKSPHESRTEEAIELRKYLRFITETAPDRLFNNSDHS